LACYAQTAPLLCSVKSGFTTVVSQRAPRIISTPRVLHRHALASKALAEHLKIILKHVSQRVNCIKARDRLFKGLYKDELIGLMLNDALFQIHILQL